MYVIPQRGVVDTRLIAYTVECIKRELKDVKTVYVDYTNDNATVDALLKESDLPFEVTPIMRTIGDARYVLATAPRGEKVTTPYIINLEDDIINSLPKGEEVCFVCDKELDSIQRSIGRRINGNYRIIKTRKY